MTPQTLAAAGGYFALLTFVHFVSDWLFQSHDDAMAKATNAWIRANHCWWYAFLFLLPLSWMGLTPGELGISMLVLFLSHFIEDTYIPVMLWAKFIRKTPEFDGRITVPRFGGFSPRIGDFVSTSENGERGDTVAGTVTDFTATTITVAVTDTNAFIAFASTPLGKILMIAIDQIIHLAFLWVPIYFALN